MNKNMKNRIITGLMIGTLGAAGLLTGCGAGGGTPDAETPRNVAMVLSGHRYFPAVPLNTDAVYSEIYDACYTYGSFSAVVVDGDPFMACSYEISASDANIDSAKRKQLAEGNAAQILTELSGLQGNCGFVPSFPDSLFRWGRQSIWMEPVFICRSLRFLRSTCSGFPLGSFRFYS